MKIKIAVAKIFNWVTKTKLRKLVASFLLVLFILTPLYSIFFISKSEAAWWNDLWSYRKKITINKSQVAGELTNFPVLVSITDGKAI